MEEELNKENIEEQKVKNFIGKNADTIYKKINERFSFNVFCMLFTFFYFLYRKMYLIGIIAFIIQGIIANYIKNTIVSVICFVIWGFAFYPLYKLHINRKLKKLNENIITEEQFKKKGGTSVISVVIIPLVLVVVLVLSLGMKIFNSTSENLENNSIDNNSNVSDNGNQNAYNYYIYNGAVIKYSNEWKEQDVSLPEGGTQKGIMNNKSGILVTIAEVESIENENLDYSNYENREKIYNLLESTFKYQASASEFEVNWQGTEHLLNNNKYYVLLDISKNGISMREYIILNVENSMVCAIATGAKSKEILDNNQAQVLELLQTLEF